MQKQERRPSSAATLKTSNKNPYTKPAYTVRDLILPREGDKRFAKTERPEYDAIVYCGVCGLPISKRPVLGARCTCQHTSRPTRVVASSGWW